VLSEQVGQVLARRGFLDCALNLLRRRMPTSPATTPTITIVTALVM
jgi:hypothetical protein